MSSKDYGQRKKCEAGSGANGQMRGRYVISNEPARHSDTLSAFRRDEGPQVGSTSRILQEVDMICEIGGEGTCAMFDVTRRRHHHPGGEADASYHQGSVRGLPRMHGQIQSAVNHVAEAIAHPEFNL